MKRYNRYLLGLLASAAVVGFSSQASADRFDISIENLSPNVLTPAVFVTHDQTADLFDAGSPASPQVERLAEDGIPDGLVELATELQGTGQVLDFGAATVDGGPIGPGQSASLNLEADQDRELLSYLSMLAFSNDAFIGATTGDNAVELFRNGERFSGSFTVDDDAVWDAGTEINDEREESVPGLGAPVDAGIPEGGVITAPHPGITGDVDIPLSRNWTDGAVARISINPADGRNGGPAPVPEPATLLLVGVGLGGLGLCGCRRSKRDRK